jgi:hypothetical protein
VKPRPSRIEAEIGQTPDEICLVFLGVATFDAFDLHTRRWHSLTVVVTLYSCGYHLIPSTCKVPHGGGSGPELPLSSRAKRSVTAPQR